MLMNVAVFLPNWIGDAVMATPALRALRDHFYDGKIIGVINPYVAGLLDGGNWFDDLILIDKCRRVQGVLSVASQLKQRVIDLAVLMPNSFRSALTAWLGRCRRRLGYARYGRSPLLTEALQPVRDAHGRLTPSPIIDAYNLLAERAGCLPPTRQMELFTTPADEAAAAWVWDHAGLTRHHEVVCLNPGAAFGSAKNWPVEYFAALARDLAAKRGSGVLVLCGPGERDLARQIVKSASHPAVHTVADAEAEGGPSLSLGLTKACVRRAGLLVTTDSGPRHFAAAFDRPVLTLFGPTHIAWTETYYSRAVHLQRQVDCGPCQRRVCPLDHRCMKHLTPAEVYDAANALLS
jgi:heptosyltransferase-2